jgi:hypothetical protein
VQTALNALKSQIEGLNQFKDTNPEATICEDFPKSLHINMQLLNLRDELMKLQDELNNAVLTGGNKQKCKPPELPSSGISRLENN